MGSGEWRMADRTAGIPKAQIAPPNGRCPGHCGAHVTLRTAPNAVCPLVVVGEEPQQGEERGRTFYAACSVVVVGLRVRTVPGGRRRRALR